MSQPKKETKTELLLQELRAAYHRMDDAGVVEIDPAYLADEAIRKMDPEKSAPILVEWAAVLELRQLARFVCRGRQADDAKRVESGQDLLFDDVLQDRYPCRRNGRDVYVLRSYMTDDEYEQNIARLSNEAVAKQRHSDALRAEQEHRRSRGDFAAAA